MKAQTHLKICAHIVALLGFWAVTFTEYFAILWPVATTAIVAAGWFYDGSTRHADAYQRIWIILGVCVLVFLPFDVFLLRNLLLPAVHVSMVVQAYFFLHPKTLVTYRRIFLVSLAQLFAATNLTTDILFAIILMVFCVVAIYGISLWQLLRGRQMSLDSSAAPPAKDTVPAGLLSLSLLWALILAPVTVGFFYSTPRLQYALITRGSTLAGMNELRRVRGMTGFARTIQLGTFGRIQEDQTLALRVEMPPDWAGMDMPLRWRGGAVNIYDGVEWSSSRDFFAYYDGRRYRTADKNSGVIFPRSPGLFITDERYAKHNIIAEFDADPALLKQVCYLEVPFSENIFGAGEIKAIEGPFNFGVSQDFNGSFSMSNRQGLPELISYTVYTSFHPPDEKGLREVSYGRIEELLNNKDYGDYVRTHYLQLPSSLNPEIKSLTLNITKDADSPYEKLEAIQSYLENRLTYSLDINPPVSNDPLYDFLFVSKSGHCEYFATAMTVMARIVGIPSRLAKGFQKGEWNGEGKFFEVRQRDAHTWVEAYFPGHGWVEFDPSPRAVADQYLENKRSMIARMLSRQFTKLQIQWRRHIIGYNETRRLHLLREVKDALLHGVPNGFAGLLDRLAETVRKLTLFHGAVVAGIMLGAFVFFHAFRKRSFLATLSWRLRRVKTARRGTLFYERMLSLLEKRKIIKPPSTTPLEFLEFPGLRESQMFSDVEKLTSIYYDVRFGDRTLSDGETAEINAILRRIIQSNGQKHKHASVAKS